MFFLLFLHDDRRIRIRIHSRIRSHSSDLSIRIREAQKHVNPVDPDSDPDPQHWLVHSSDVQLLKSSGIVYVLFHYFYRTFV